MTKLKEIHRDKDYITWAFVDDKGDELYDVNLEEIVDCISGDHDLVEYHIYAAITAAGLRLRLCMDTRS